MRILLAAAGLYTAVSAATQLQNGTVTNTTTTGHVGWVPTSPGRSSSDIIWSCLAVLIVCTYKCVHLNIPSFEEKRAGWYKIPRLGIPYWPERPLLQKWLRKLRWMGLVLIAPEMGVATAFLQFIQAKESLKEAQTRYPDEKLSLTHAFYANMGGFAHDLPRKGVDKTVKTATQAVPEGTQEPYVPSSEIDHHANGDEEAAINSKADAPPQSVKSLDDPDLRSSSLLENPGASITLLTYVLDCKNHENGTLRIISKDSIDDRSKSDVFTKLFAIVQSTWLVVQCLSRAAAGLPITELELATMAYVLCAITMYALWWYKPFDAEYVTLVPRNQPGGKTLPKWERKADITMDHFIGMLYGVEDLRSDDAQVSFVFYFVATIFSAIHLAAWNWEFAFPIVRNLWRASSLCATTVGFLSLSYIPIFNFFQDFLHITLGDSVGGVITICLVLLYIGSRVGLIVLILYSFSSMPASVYETVDWTTYIPHFS